MNLVLDSNVLIAALIARGRCAELLEYCVSSHTVIASDFILDEVQKHLVGKFKRSAADAEQAIGLLRSVMVVVDPSPLNQPVCRDPDDDLILATAVAGRANCIITGDNDLLILRQHAGIRILRPGDFPQWEAEQAASELER
jgi:putative PIN family toxin of toxin-antitoxin system